MEKISISKIISNSFILPWNNLLFYSQVLAIPILALVSVWSIWAIISPTGQASSYLFFFIYFSVFSYLAITCHKLILTKNRKINEIVSINIKQMLRFILMASIIYIMSFIIKFIILTIYLNIFSEPPSSDIRIEVAEYIAYLPSMYIIGRLCLIFPAIALGYKPSLKWAWRATRNNHLHILVIVAIFPWVLQILLSLLYRENATLIEQVIISLMTYISAILAVFAISLTYKELHEIEHKNL